MLSCYHPLVHIDTTVFGADAGEFKPKRFVGNPGLKKEVSSYPPIMSALDAAPHSDSLMLRILRASVLSLMNGSCLDAEIY